MTKDEIIRMAKEAGLPIHWMSDKGVLSWVDLERFAHLVSAHEREACAKECDKPWHVYALQAAIAIRARGQA